MKANVQAGGEGQPMGAQSSSSACFLEAASRRPGGLRSTSSGCAAARFPVRDYCLASTLGSGQAFRWQARGDRWIGVIGSRWVELHIEGDGLAAQTAEPVTDWSWLREYLQLDLDLDQVLSTFPDDKPMRAAMAGCKGLRLLRQEPWECLASFILSSTKQIVQIQQIVALLCERFGAPICVPPGQAPMWAFPSARRLAQATEAELRGCKMGFRAPNLLATANIIASGQLDLDQLKQMPVEKARAALMELPGVGRKIADCVLLFAYEQQSAFPVDVWIMRTLQQLYFPRRKVTLERLHRFAASHFGPYAGYAQQYLFHHARSQPSV